MLFKPEVTTTQCNCLIMSLPTLYQYYTNGGIKKGLSADQSYFTLNNKNITIFSGTLHYFRVPQQYWRDRLRKMRAAGLNAVETYVPWNLHEPEPGIYDFGEGGSDFQDFLHVNKFLKIAQEEDLFAIVRPGPFICAEWDWGGLPSWLLREKDIQVRTNDKIFMNYVEKYFRVLFTILVSLQFTKGGPIIAFQIENEYGSFNRDDQPYLQGLKNIFIKNGIIELLFTSDGPLIGNQGQIPGVLYTANIDEKIKQNLDALQKYQPDKPTMVMEYWSGWFDHWTEKHHKVSLSNFSNTLIEILNYPSSVNFYMFHGGTSFGFMNGANIKDLSIDNQGYQPDTNSYDYDCPLNENGDYTEKYYRTEELIAKYNKIQTFLPKKPEPILRKKFDNIKIIEELSLNEIIEQIPNKFFNQNVIPMELFPIKENLGQSYGYVVYRKNNLNIPPNSFLQINGRVCDTVVVLINGELKSKITTKQSDLDEFGYWRLKDSTLHFGNEEIKNATLDLLVENWGRNNFGTLDQFVQHKGLWQGNIKINREDIFDWEIFPLEFKKNLINNFKKWHQPTFSFGPKLFKGILNIEDNSFDTYIDMRDWKKGFVAINGFVLSRHFNLGPQQTVYLPAPFLKKGLNEIVIFEHFQGLPYIVFSENQIFNTLP